MDDGIFATLYRRVQYLVLLYSSTSLIRSTITGFQGRPSGIPGSATVTSSSTREDEATISRDLLLLTMMGRQEESTNGPSRPDFCAGTRPSSRGASGRDSSVNMHNQEPSEVEMVSASMSRLKGIILKAKNVAEAALFLASDESAYLLA